MKYPTIEEVDAADHEQICYWYRFLESPGMSAINSSSEVYETVSRKECEVMNRMSERLKEFGGFTPEISKKIGWIRPK